MTRLPMLYAAVSVPHPAFGWAQDGLLQQLAGGEYTVEVRGRCVRKPAKLDHGTQQGVDLGFAAGLDILQR